MRANEVSVSYLLKDFYANGNPISVEDTTANTLRVMQWDEENRLVNSSRNHTGTMSLCWLCGMAWMRWRRDSSGTEPYILLSADDSCEHQHDE